MTLKRLKQGASKRERFSFLLEIAKDIVDRDPTALVEYVRLLGRPHQATWMLEAAARKEHDAPWVNPEMIMFSPLSKIGPDNKNIQDYFIKVHSSRSLQLGRDLVLPCPWERSRIVDNFTSIGPQRPAGRWEQDRKNHFVKYWLPLGIGWVSGGNHSITVGIIQNQGSIRTREIYDISPIYPYLRTDGENYILENGKVLCRVKNVEFAAIYEIGRLMLEHGVSA